MSGCFLNYPDSPLYGCQKVYLIHVPAGAGIERMLNVFLDSAVCRGLHAEGYYCPTQSLQPSWNISSFRGLASAFSPAKDIGPSQDIQ
jgi:hypothetical protein